MKTAPFLFALLIFSLPGRAQIFTNTTLTAANIVTSSFINDQEGWLMDNNSMIYHTTNGSNNWESFSAGKNFFKLHFTGPIIGYALAEDGAYKTTDGGHTWSPMDLPGNFGNALYFIDDQTGFISGYQLFYRTDDGGATWSTISTDEISFTDVSFTSALVGIATAYDDESSGKCIYRTTDGGLTWKNVFQQANYYMNSVSFIDENTGRAAGYYDDAGMGKEPEIISTTDGGNTWNSIYRNTEIARGGEAFTDIRFRNAMEGYAISHFSYDVYTTDGGETWNLIHKTDTLGLSPLYGVYKTLDGYATLYLSGEDGNLAIWK